ncbi:PREDICTED: cysteine-rich receptor-like protein kinase 2 [Ipomoea nil]|uniref:cysteine-rich receptor-like protein kinase 2 n=1 Tax=Ipomoea nil TaxID=35883 RepID=UPI0009017A29|nr:PREDICTED: cysteine-rich receptor-like protein kinase 2 [Ipomoea nil]
MAAGSGRWWWFAVVITVVSVSEPALSNPQTNQVGVLGCSPFNYTDVADSMRVLNATFADLRNQLSSGNKRFATSTQQPVYAMAQCRNYLSTADCVACLDAAVVATRNCSNKTGGRINFDGCFLRYEDSYFYDQITGDGTYPTCGKRTAPDQYVFNMTAKQVLYDLQLATPRINGFFAAAKQEASGGGGAAFAVAQCIETIDEIGCQACLTITYRNILGCLPKSAAGRAFAPGCFMRYSNKRFFPNNQTTNLAPFLETGSSGKKKAIIAGVVGGVGIILVLAAIFLYRRSKKPNAARRGNILGATQLRGPENYRYKDLKAATKGFSEENKLGQGGFGDVYKGTLKNGDVVAVKKLAMISSRAKADFETEVRLITNVHHRNLIRLLGCSAKGEELLLVYEYMANASLDRYIYGDKRGMLNWKQRVNIILGTAMGLVYLHHQFHVCIIHRDIKSSNILLDDDFQPKIADFGLARLLPQNQSHVSTKFAGTLGYTAPEYAIHGHLSEKVDIYSFGIVILEIISGRRSSDIRVEPVTEYLLEQAWKLYENEEHLRLVDSTLDPNDYTAEEVKRILEIALVCTQSPPNLRPSMSEVVIMLSSSDRSIFQNQPNRPTVISDLGNRVQVLTDTSSPSHATASISDVSGR